MLAPVRVDEDLMRVESRAYLHPLVIFWVHAAEALQITEPRCHVLAKMTCVWRAMLVEVLKVRAEKISRIGPLAQAAELRVVLEKVHIQAELISRKRRREPEWTSLSGEIPL